MIYHTCDECGTAFIYNSQSIYKLRDKQATLFYCCHTCYRKAKKRIEARRLAERRARHAARLEKGWNKYDDR